MFFRLQLPVLKELNICVCTLTLSLHASSRAKSLYVIWGKVKLCCSVRFNVSCNDLPYGCLVTTGGVLLRHWDLDTANILFSGLFFLLLFSLFNSLWLGGKGDVSKMRLGNKICGLCATQSWDSESPDPSAVRWGRNILWSLWALKQMSEGEICRLLSCTLSSCWLLYGRGRCWTFLLNWGFELSVFVSLYWNSERTLVFCQQVSARYQISHHLWESLPQYFSYLLSWH